MSDFEFTASFIEPDASEPFALLVKKRHGGVREPAEASSSIIGLTATVMQDE